MTIDEKLDMLIELTKDNGRRIETVENRIETVEKRIKTVEKEATNIKLTLENETNHNIKIIAEGHLDLSCKLNETIRIASDIKAKQELQDIYLNMHENKLKTIM